MEKNLNAILPDGTPFAFWEKECTWKQTLYVDGSNPAATDAGEGSTAEEKSRLCVCCPAAPSTVRP